MFCFWMYLSLSFVLQHSVSSDEASLDCRRTMVVTSGDPVTLHCDIVWMKDCEEKSGNFSWNQTKGNNLCDLEGNTCESDGQTYGSLTISDVQKSEDISVMFTAVCGMDGPSIRVLDVLSYRGPTSGQETFEGKNSKAGTWVSVPAVILLVIAVIIVTGILFFQFKIQQNKKDHELDLRSKGIALNF